MSSNIIAVFRLGESASAKVKYFDPQPLLSKWGETTKPMGRNVRGELVMGQNDQTPPLVRVIHTRGVTD